MIFNGRWDKPKLVLYLQAGKAFNMLDFSLNQAVKNSGMREEDYDLVVLCWRTSQEIYDYLKKRNIKYVDMEYEPDKDFVWNLYKGWNLGYEIGYKYADYVCPIATDHAFYKNWLANLFSWAKPNRIVNCKLIEPGTLPTIHTAVNFGLTTRNQFKQKEFEDFCAKIYKDELVTDEKKYGRRFDAMPFVCPMDVWERFGPQSPLVRDDGLTGDVDFFNRCKAGGVEIVKALNAISYHCGGIETYQNASVFGKIKIRISAKLPNLIKKVLRKYLR